MSTKQLSITRTHKLNFYWSAFSQEPDAVCDVPAGVVLQEWLSDNVQGFDPNSDKVSYSQPLADIVDGDIDCFFVPKGKAVQSILKPVFKLLGFNTAKPKNMATADRGNDIDLSMVQGNQVKYGEPVRELFGRMKVYPDILVPLRRYFENKKDHWTEMLLCVGVGEYRVPLGDIRFGGTPVVSIGDGATVKVYQPGEDLSQESAADFWYTAPEVGATSSGSGGLPLENAYDATPQADKGKMLFSGKTISSSTPLFPDDWEQGMRISIQMLRSYSVSGSTITGSFSGLQAEVGDELELHGDYTGLFTVLSVTDNDNGSISIELDEFVTSQPEVELSVSKYGEYFELVGASTTVLTVDRKKQDGSSDWNGWDPEFTTLDADILLGGDGEGGWQGWFDVQPLDRDVTEVELDLLFPQGLYSVDKKGRSWYQFCDVTIQWREKGSLIPSQKKIRYNEHSLDQIAFTERFTLSKGKYEFRVKRDRPESTVAWYTDKTELFGLRSKISDRPNRYPEFTTVAVKVKGSHVVSAEADTMLSVVAERILGGEPTRSIDDAVRYICRKHDLDERSLQQASEVWSRRGELFDHSFEKHATIKQALDTVLSVGFAEPTVKNGLISIAHDIPRDLNLRKQVFSAQNTTAEIVTEISLPDDDEVDGIDVEYIDSRNFRVETVKCRLPGSKELKVQKMKADGITDRTRAYRWGMRELSKIRYQRRRISTSTELDALNCNYGDLAAFVDDVPSYGQSTLAVSRAGRVVTVTEKLDWSGNNHVAALRDEFGRMTEVVAVERVNDKSFRLSKEVDVSVKPYETQVFFGRSDRFVSHAIVDSVSPQAGYNATISATGYTDIIYAYDNAEADN